MVLTAPLSMSDDWWSRLSLVSDSLVLVLWNGVVLEWVLLFWVWLVVLECRLSYWCGDVLLKVDVVVD